MLVMLAVVLVLICRYLLLCLCSLALPWLRSGRSRACVSVELAMLASSRAHEILSGPMVYSTRNVDHSLAMFGAK